jgi:hypothetical protein
MNMLGVNQEIAIEHFTARPPIKSALPANIPPQLLLPGLHQMPGLFLSLLTLDQLNAVWRP